jgi:hypothetical protein
MGGDNHVRVGSVHIGDVEIASVTQSHDQVVRVEFSDKADHATASQEPANDLLHLDSGFFHFQKLSAEHHCLPTALKFHSAALLFLLLSEPIDSLASLSNSPSTLGEEQSKSKRETNQRDLKHQCRALFEQSLFFGFKSLDFGPGLPNSPRGLEFDRTSLLSQSLSLCFHCIDLSSSLLGSPGALRL